MSSIRLVPQTIRTVAFGGIDITYNPLGTPLTAAASIILLQNNTDASVFISLDGVNDHFFIPTNGFILLDLTTNKSLDQGAFISQGTQFYVRLLFAAATTNAVYLSVMSGFQGNA
jgi:hypothetical protein